MKRHLLSYHPVRNETTRRAGLAANPRVARPESAKGVAYASGPIPRSPTAAAHCPPAQVPAGTAPPPSPIPRRSDRSPPRLRNELRNMSVSMIPGLSGTAAMPRGSSWANACVSPSTPHLVAQYGATSGEVERPQPELKFTITPFSRDHRRREMPDHVRRSLEVHVDHAIEFVGLDFPQHAVGVDHAGVVDEQVGRPVGQDTSWPTPRPAPPA